MNKVTTISFWKDHRNLIHGYSTKSLGNLSIRSDSQTTISQRRKEYARKLGIDEKNILFLPLSHSNKVLSLPVGSRVLKNEKGVYISGGKLFPAMKPVHDTPEWQDGIDAVVTNMENVFPTILSADCAAVGFFDKANATCALAHVGLIGGVNQIVSNTIRCLVQDYHSNPRDIEVIIFPSIRKCHYNLALSGAWKHIKDDVINHYGSSSPFFSENHFDLQSLISEQILLEGIPSENIYDTNMCTMCHREVFYSNMAAGDKESKKTEGRFASTIGKKSE